MTVKPRIKADGEDDRVEYVLKKAGCLELHYKVQECINTTGDWRKCQDVVKDFKVCISKYKQEVLAGLKN